MCVCLCGRLFVFIRPHPLVLSLFFLFFNHSSYISSFFLVTFFMLTFFLPFFLLFFLAYVCLPRRCVSVRSFIFIRLLHFLYDYLNCFFLSFLCPSVCLYVSLVRVVDPSKTNTKKFLIRFFWSVYPSLSRSPCLICFHSFFRLCIVYASQSDPVILSSQLTFHSSQVAGGACL